MLHSIELVTQGKNNLQHKMQCNVQWNNHLRQNSNYKVRKHTGTWKQTQETQRNLEGRKNTLLNTE